MTKHYGYFIAAALWLTACAEAQHSNDTTTTQPGTQICEQLSCPNGCCDGRCVDLRSDPNHCGTCEHACATGICQDSQCSIACEGDSHRICQGKCVDITSDENNCGSCQASCGDNMACQSKQCVCKESYSDCDGNILNGCETFSETCACRLGQTTSCYPTDNKYINVGICKAGNAVCLADGTWDYCEGYILPSQTEIPDNGLDDNCNGTVDEDTPDLDGDGWTIENGDCCDDIRTCKLSNPAGINPNAYDIPDNGIDDDCDGIIDNPTEKYCSTQSYRPQENARLTRNDAVKLAQAMDICTTATETSGFGLIQADLLLADGTTWTNIDSQTKCGTRTIITPAQQVSVLTALGQNQSLPPISGSTMAVLSSGKATGNENTGLDDCMGSEVSVPKVFLDAHEGFLPSATSCNTTPKGKMANDSVMLRLKLRAPSNAMGFKFKFKFFSKEYPEFVCGNYNDFFLALMNGKSSKIPADHNISFDSNHNPVSVNNAFFTECTPGSCTAAKGCSECPNGDKDVKAYLNPDTSNTVHAGATGWLTTSMPVEPNEVFTLDLIIFDASDVTYDHGNGYGHLKDSLVLLDGFEWTTTKTELITVDN